MYRWREMSPEQRLRTLAYRHDSQLPWHSVPHYEAETPYYMSHGGVLRTSSS